MPGYTGTRGEAVTIDAGDVQIGAVELKDQTGSARATVTAGGELLVTATDTIPVVDTPAAVTIDNIADNDVSTVETIIAANADRKAFLVQNIEADGGQVARVTWDGVDATATLGAQLRPGASLYMETPFCGVAAVKAVAESGTVTLHVTEFD